MSLSQALMMLNRFDGLMQGHAVVVSPISDDVDAGDTAIIMDVQTEDTSKGFDSYFSQHQASTQQPVTNLDLLYHAPENLLFIDAQATSKDLGYFLLSCGVKVNSYSFLHQGQLYEPVFGRPLQKVPRVWYEPQDLPVTTITLSRSTSPLLMTVPENEIFSAIIEDTVGTPEYIFNPQSVSWGATQTWGTWLRLAATSRDFTEAYESAAMLLWVAWLRGQQKFAQRLNGYLSFLQSRYAVMSTPFDRSLQQLVASETYPLSLRQWENSWVKFCVREKAH